MAEPLTKPVAYDEDFYAWTQDQAARLRARAHNGIDWENAAEEIESLGKSQRSEIRSRILVVLIHLLKWKYQPDQRSSGWKGTLAEQRDKIAEEVEESPSLRAFPASVVDRQYRTARLKAAGEIGLLDDAFPPACPFTVEQILDPDFFPEAE